MIGIRSPYGVPRIPPAIRMLLIANVAVFVLQILIGVVFLRLVGVPFFDVFGLRPATVLERGWVWQPLTYMFLHGGLFHLLINMFVLWMFGVEIEGLWGRERFFRYYFACGLGAAALSFVFSFHSTIIGASGAVLGILLAYGMLFPNRTILLWFIIPVRAKYLVMGIAALEFLYVISGTGGAVANAAHLGGMVTGYALLRWEGKRPFGGRFSRWRRRHLKLVDGGAGGGPGSSVSFEAELDRILDKISHHGLASLSPEEERILEEASRRRTRD